MALFIHRERCCRTVVALRSRERLFRIYPQQQQQCSRKANCVVGVFFVGVRLRLSVYYHMIPVISLLARLHVADNNVNIYDVCSGHRDSPSIPDLLSFLGMLRCRVIYFLRLFVCSLTLLSVSLSPHQQSASLRRRPIRGPRVVQEIIRSLQQ